MLNCGIEQCSSPPPPQSPSYTKAARNRKEDTVRFFPRDNLGTTGGVYLFSVHIVSMSLFDGKASQKAVKIPFKTGAIKGGYLVKQTIQLSRIC